MAYIHIYTQYNISLSLSLSLSPLDPLRYPLGPVGAAVVQQVERGHEQVSLSAHCPQMRHALPLPTQRPGTTQKVQRAKKRSESQPGRGRGFADGKGRSDTRVARAAWRGDEGG